MIKEATGVKINRNQLAALHQTMLENKDEENAEKILELYNKLEQAELVVSFSGHFSAGKSSIINHLLDKEILPKSPIPTSANIVKMTSGEGWARVYFNDEPPVEYREPYDIDMIKQYSQDKDTIKRIEISTSEPIIPNGAAIIDTPGIDAADDADRLMTEGSLHLVDVLFYVMDYNHVQSEVNLYFLKSLQESEIPFYLIINQIDKHNENELSFESYAHQIKQTFFQWGIRPLGTFFTSLFDFSSKHNQFDEVKEILFSMMRNDSVAYLNIDASVRQVMTKHKKFLQDHYEERMTGFAENEETESQLAEIQEIIAQIDKLNNDAAELEKEFQKELNTTLKNAYLMPKNLRDIAESYLESTQNSFKVGGLFGAKKKTEEEKQIRAKNFETKLQETIESSVQWKLRDKFIEISRRFNLTDAATIEELNNLSISYTKENLQKNMKPGAQINGDYVLNYTNDVANDIKSKFRRRALRILDLLQQALKEKNAATLEELQSKYDNLQEAQQIKEQYDALQKELNTEQKNVDQQLEYPQFNQENWDGAIREFVDSQSEFIVQESPLQLEKEEQVKREADDPEEPLEKAKENPYTSEEIVGRIDQTLDKVQTLPGFQDLVADLETKKDRLMNRTYTIALFGAFSAGKSSFSNALIGERVLPVSPNPTTATVNRIHPVSEMHPHGTVVVQMKDEETLMDELYMMTDKFSPKANNLEEFIQWVSRKKIHRHKKLNNMYQAYIQALITGYEENQALVGEETVIRVEEFAKYVTDETIACYIKAIDLYYDSAITRHGITLVDTPGADSVNARHTNVAFEYIKHADAILYVTYYNHALSRADRDFLMQLGRVKEVFQLDKMFFIVNAADLAENDEELQLVLNYVKDELNKLGIHQAKILPVSSKQSLEEKLESITLNQQMQQFEDAFYSFIHHDLAMLMIDSTLWDIKRVYRTLDHYISSVSLNQSEKDKQKQQIKTDEEKALQFISNYETAVYVQQIEQRVEKQLYYVIERLSIRFHDMFKEMFNPTTITENGRKAQDELKQALENLIEYVRFELTQELQAVSLRIEGYMKELAAGVYQTINEGNKAVNGLFELPREHAIEVSTPDYENNFKNLAIKDFNEVLRTYKSTKSFFAQNEKEMMKDKLYSSLLPHAESFVEENKEIMHKAYIKQWDVQVKEMKDAAKKKLNQHINNYFEMMEAPADINLLKENLSAMEKLVK